MAAMTLGGVYFVIDFRIDRGLSYAARGMQREEFHRLLKFHFGKNQFQTSEKAWEALHASGLGTAFYVTEECGAVL